MSGEQQLALPIVHIGNFSLNIAAIAGVDWNGYEVGTPDRTISLHLIGGSCFEFVASEADTFKEWFESATGRAKVMRYKTGPIG